MFRCDEDFEDQKPTILQRENLMQLLADAITFNASVVDVEFILQCGANVNNTVKVIVAFLSQ